MAVGKYDPLDLVLGDVLTEARAAAIETQYKYAKDRSIPLGGMFNVGTMSEAWEDIPGFIEVELAEQTAIRIRAMCVIVSGGVGGSPATEGSFRLWDQTNSEVVAGSETAFDDATPTLQQTAEIVLEPSIRYRLQSRISDTAESAIVYGAQMVTQ